MSPLPIGMIPFPLLNWDNSKKKTFGMCPGWHFMLAIKTLVLSMLNWYAPILIWDTPILELG
jgi:hypothetical protein